MDSTKELRVIFSTEKIRKDVFDYLKDSPYHEDNGSGEYLVGITKSSREEILLHDISINKQDKITLFSINVYDLILFGDEYVSVQIIIGNYTYSKSGIVTIEKCYATLKYNSDFSLYDIDFSNEA